MVERSDLAPEEPRREATGTAAPRELSDDQVARHLRRHPDFFVRHPELLDSLETPNRHQTANGLVDFQHAVTQRLRGEVERLTRARDDLVAVGRGNLSVQSRIHKAVDRLLEARSFEQFIETVTTDVAALLDLDIVVIGVEREGAGFPRSAPRGVVCLPNGTVAQQFGPGSAILLRERIVGDPVIYGAGAGLVRSEAMIRLAISDESPQALLALASRTPDQFNRNQGTELLSFLGRVVESCFRAWLDLRHD